VSSYGAREGAVQEDGLQVLRHGIAYHRGGRGHRWWRASFLKCSDTSMRCGSAAGCSPSRPLQEPQPGFTASTSASGCTWGRGSGHVLARTDTPLTPAWALPTMGADVRHANRGIRGGSHARVLLEAECAHGMS
jgi:hypothetical protein